MTVASEGFNQDGVIVISYRRTLLVYRRGHQPSSTLSRPDESSLPATEADGDRADPRGVSPVSTGALPSPPCSCRATDPTGTPRRQPAGRTW